MNIKKFVAGLTALALCVSMTALAVHAQTGEYPKISPKLQEVMQSGETLIEVGVWYQPIEQNVSPEIYAILNTEKAARIAQEIGLESDSYWCSKYAPLFITQMTVEQIKEAAVHAEVQELSNGMETEGDIIENATQCPTEDGFAGIEEPTETGLNLCDVNGDGVTNAVDAAHVLVFAAQVGSGSFTGSGELDFSRADFNNDGVINAKDAADVLVYAASAGAGDADPEEPITEIDISVYSRDELAEMYSSLTLSDEEFEAYLDGLQNGASLTRQDIRSFVETVGDLPVNVPENYDITWINHRVGVSEDTGETYDVVYVTMESPDGAWRRYEYVLSATDVKAAIERDISDPSFTGERLAISFTNSYGEIKLYAYSQEPHVSGNGTLATLYLDFSGLYIRVYEKTNGEESVDPQAVVEGFKQIEPVLPV
ncbi:MAG: dockerin type I repeat-containing protein [Oscillospiraceae bacterium]|nr:dockerin type I repeat-containing protein [Oscillospiraceae bacterium]